VNRKPGLDSFGFFYLNSIAVWFKSQQYLKFLRTEAFIYIFLLNIAYADKKKYEGEKAKKLCLIGQVGIENSACWNTVFIS